MIKFLLNNQEIETELPRGMTVLDFVRYREDLKGTKIGCREGDCGACTVLVGEPDRDAVVYRTMTSCLMPLGNAAGKHIVTVEGINPPEDGLTPVQELLIDEGGTQCGFCTVGFVMSMTGYCVDSTEKTREMAVSAIDGNICRCTGYKSIERAVIRLSDSRKSRPDLKETIDDAIADGIVPKYFGGIRERLNTIADGDASDLRSEVVVGGGTDLYVQQPDEMVETGGAHVLFADRLRGISRKGDTVEIGASATVTDLLESELMHQTFPELYDHLKLVSSTPIRNMATLAGNFVNASPIGDMTIWFLALDAVIRFSSGRTIPLRKFFKGYKLLDKTPEESIEKILFDYPDPSFLFNFEKVCKRQYLDIATVNSAASFVLDDGKIAQAHVAAGGVAPVPLYLAETSRYLVGTKPDNATLEDTCDIAEKEISPISDVRGSEEYKRLLLRQLIKAHFVELFGLEQG